MRVDPQAYDNSQDQNFTKICQQKSSYHVVQYISNALKHERVTKSRWMMTDWV